MKLKLMLTEFRNFPFIDLDLSHLTLKINFKKNIGTQIMDNGIGYGVSKNTKIDKQCSIFFISKTLLNKTVAYLPPN